MHLNVSYIKLEIGMKYIHKKKIHELHLLFIISLRAHHNSETV